MVVVVYSELMVHFGQQVRASFAQEHMHALTRTCCHYGCLLEYYSGTHMYNVHAVPGLLEGITVAQYKDCLRILQWHSTMQDCLRVLQWHSTRIA